MWTELKAFFWVGEDTQLLGWRPGDHCDGSPFGGRFHPEDAGDGLGAGGAGGDGVVYA